MGGQCGDRVVVLGGSIAGLLAARVLSDAYREVLVVDRDELIGVTGYRRGVPHGRHAHGLLARGQQILEELLPGLTDGLVRAGVVTGDFNRDNSWYVNGRRLAPGESGLLCVPATRPVLEYHIRERVQAIPNVKFVEQRDIAGLTASSGRITGVRVTGRDDGTEELIEADLVVDATGRGSRTPVWLAELGYRPPPEDRVKINLGYSTRHFRLRTNRFGSMLGIIPVASPNHPRGAFFYPTPGDRQRTELTLTGMVGDYPPTDPAGFMEFAKSLPVPEIYEWIRDAEPLDDAVAIKFPANVRRRYERLDTFPDGLLVMGDAVCSFNPLYGQGMSVSALEALALRDQLADGPPQPRRFFSTIARAIAAPWDLTTSGDLAFPTVEGRPRTTQIRLVNAYVARLHMAAVHDPTLTTAFLRAAGLVDSPQSLMRPRIMSRVLLRRSR